jgi:hypothetical protein
LPSTASVLPPSAPRAIVSLVMIGVRTIPTLRRQSDDGLENQERTFDRRHNLHDVRLHYSRPDVALTFLRQNPVT